MALLARHFGMSIVDGKQLKVWEHRTLIDTMKKQHRNGCKVCGIERRTRRG